MRGWGWIFVGAAGLALAALSQVDAVSPIGAAAITVTSSVVLALLAHGGPALATEAVAMGASGAIAYEAARPYVPLAAAGLLLMFVFATRAMRSRTWRELAFHVLLAFFAGTAASWVMRAEANAETSLFLVALVVAALLSSMPWMLPSDAPRTFALRRLASRSRGLMRLRMLRASAAHRMLRDVELPRDVRKRIEAGFDRLLQQVGRRLDSNRTDGVPDKIRDHVNALVRVARAARQRESLLEALDGPDERMRSESDALEAEVAALRLV